MVLKAQELRIANLIKGIYHDYDDGIDEEIENETICEVVTLDVSGSGDYSIYVYSDENIENFSDFKPIPLTEEWLLKFGFDKVGIALTSIAIAPLNLPCTFNLPNTPFSFCQGKLILTTGTGDFCVNIEYVHQLQNLHFALTGEELELKNEGSEALKENNA